MWRYIINAVIRNLASLFVSFSSFQWNLQKLVSIDHFFLSSNSDWMLIKTFKHFWDALPLQYNSTAVHGNLVPKTPTIVWLWYSSSRCTHEPSWYVSWYKGLVRSIQVLVRLDKTFRGSGVEITGGNYACEYSDCLISLTLADTGKIWDVFQFWQKLQKTTWPLQQSVNEMKLWSGVVYTTL